jgi:hypothetical protein
VWTHLEDVTGLKLRTAGKQAQVRWIQEDHLDPLRPQDGAQGSKISFNADARQVEIPQDATLTELNTLGRRNALGRILDRPRPTFTAQDGH